MKKRTGKILIFMLVLAVVVTTLFATGVLAHAETEGVWTYTVADDSATIVLVDASAKGEVTVPETLGGYPVRTIAENAFRGGSQITILTVPDCVETIGKNAFKGCTALTTITLPFVGANASGVTNGTLSYVIGSVPSTLTTVTVTGGYMIGENAFRYCPKLLSVTLPNTITSIGRDAFSSCNALTSIVIPASVRQIGDNAFTNAGLTDVTLQDGLASIGKQAFMGTKLSTVTIPDSVTSIGSHAFYNCDSLIRVTLPTGIVTIPEYMFGSCSALQSISIPANVNSIGRYAFYGCTALTTLTVPGTVASIGEYSFQNCTGLTQVNIRGVNVIGENAFNGCSGLVQLTLENGVATIGKGAFYGCAALRDVTIPDSVAVIGEESFCGCSGIKTLSIPGTTEVISRSAFDFCSSLTDLTINEGTTTIHDFAFSSCTNLRTVSIPASVDLIGKGVFAFAPLLSQITVASGNPVYYVQNNCLIDRDMQSLICATTASTIPTDGSVCEIGPFAFAGKTSMTSITIPDTITAIGDSAFIACSSLVNLTVPDSVEVIGYAAFRNCTGLTKITLPFVGATASGTTNCYIGYVFGATSPSNNNNYLPSTLKTVVVTGGYRIGEYAFLSCHNLTSVTLPDTIGSIGGSAFQYCSGLKTIAIPASVTQIGGSAFSQAGLTGVTLKSGLLSIGASAFVNTNLTTVTIPNSVTSIGDSAFSNCTALIRATLPTGIVKIQASMFQTCTSLQSISIPANVTAIEPYAFYGCTSLTRVTVPGTVGAIGAYAFADCTGLMQATLQDGVETIGEYAFSGCTGMTKVTVPRSVTTIAENAFFNRFDAMKMYGYKDSYAEGYALDHDIPFVYLDEPEAKYTVKFVSEGTVVSEAQLEAGAAIVKPADPQKTGYTFAGWTPAVPATMPAADQTFTAVFTANKHKVTYDFAGGTANGKSSYTAENVEYGAAIPACPLTPERDGFAFTGWAGAYSGTTMPDADVTYTAQWTPLGRDVIAVTQTPAKLEYAIGETLDTTGLAVTLTRADGTTADVTADCTFTGFDSATAGEKTVTVHYNDLTATFTVTVAEPDPVNPVSLAITGRPSKTVYKIGDALDTTGLEVTLNFSDGTAQIVTADCTFSGFDSATAGTKRITVAYGGFTATFDVTVSDDELVSPISIQITKQPTKTEYRIGEPFSKAGLEITATFADGSTAVVTDDCVFTGFDSSKPGRKVVTISYNSLRTSLTVEIIPDETDALVYVEPAIGYVGQTVDVAIRICNNPGVIATRLSVAYDSDVLQLVSARNGSVITGGAFTTSQSLNVNPFVVLWNDSLATQNYTEDGELLVLTFSVSETAAVSETQITVTYEPSATFNKNLDFVALKTQNGTVTVANRIIGDADGDGVLTLRDVAVLRRYLAGWNGYSVNARNADVNGDGEVTVKDVVLMERFLAGWDVTLI